MTNNKKGYSAINVIIGVLALLLTMNLLIEITVLGQRYSYMAQTTSYVSRILGEQGGIRSGAPQGYPDSIYTTNNEMFNILNQGFEDARFDDWELRINGQRFGPGTQISIPEQQQIRMELIGRYHPIFNIRGSSARLHEVRTNRITYSTFQIRSDGFGFD